MKTAYLISDRKEKYNLKRSWFVKKYRIVDKDGKDLVQPWLDTKKEAMQYTKNRYDLIDKT